MERPIKRLWKAQGSTQDAGMKGDEACRGCFACGCRDCT